MRVLGICHDVYMCSAAIVQDGRVLSAVAEERLDRRKQSRTFPALAIQACLDDGGLSLADIDEIAVGWNPSIELQYTAAGYLGARRSRVEHLIQVPARFAGLLKTGPAREMTITGAADGCPPITYVDHYDAHIGAGYFMSPFDEAAILILDGRGERQTGLLAHAQGHKIRRIREVTFPHSLGLFYGAITEFLGFRPDSDEWKVMALGSFVDPADNPFAEVIDRLVHVGEDGRFELALDQFAFYNFWEREMFTEGFEQALGPRRSADDEITLRHQQIAAAAQSTFERAATAILNRLHEETGSPRLVLGGGCFMNSVFNGKVLDVTPFEEVYVGSCPDDSGTSLGAALYLEAQRSEQRLHGGNIHNYWGPGFGDDECRQTAERFRLPYEIVGDRAQHAAQDLADGKIVGWFQGRIEFGQRALGNRSILLDPRREDGKEVVNAAVKYREAFRPFAPAILADRMTEWFATDVDVSVDYMEKVLPFRAGQAERVPAVVHVDGSGRLQTVTAEGNALFHELISHFDKLTDVPIVLNTSFNLNGEPIVCTPEDAVRTFYSCGLDVLYLGNVRLVKQGSA